MRGLHTPAVLSAHLVKGMCDLSQRAIFYGFHQCFKKITVGNGHLFQILQRGIAFRFIPFPEGMQVLDLLFFLFFRGTDHFHWQDGWTAGLVQECVDTNERQFTGMFLVFVKKAFFLDLVALVHTLHGTQHATSFRDTVKFYIGASNKIGYWAKSKMYGEGASGSNSYSVFLQGDLPIVKMETQHGNGRKIAIVKESYGNAFAPFLVNNYEKVIVVDQRYYTGDFIAMLKAEGINELLFINNIFAAHTPFHIDKIKNLKTGGGKASETKQVKK